MNKKSILGIVLLQAVIIIFLIFQVYQLNTQIDDVHVELLINRDATEQLIGKFVQSNDVDYNKKIDDISKNLNELQENIESKIEIQKVQDRFYAEIDNVPMVFEDYPRVNLTKGFAVYNPMDGGYNSFTLESGFSDLERMNEMLDSFRELYERTHEQFSESEKEEIGNMFWEIHYIGTPNMNSSVLASLYSGMYEISKLSYEKSIYQYKCGEITLEDLEKQYLKHIEDKKGIIEKSNKLAFPD